MSYYMSDRHKAAIKRWSEKNPDRVREIARNHYNRKKKEDPKSFYAKKIWKERRRVSKNKNVPFNISFDYIMSLPSEKCPVFGVDLEWGTGSYNTASLDKIIPQLGYIEGNVIWMSFRANILKRDSTKEEIEKLLEWFNSV